MKKVFKFTLAALAATVLASCSTDDFSSFGTEKGQLKKGDLIVKVEGMDSPAMTRAMLDNNRNFYWQNGDEVLVYDATLIKYDKFKYDIYDGFTRQKDSTNLSSVKYAVFLGNDPVQRNEWNYEDNSVKLAVNISSTMDWSREEVRNDKGEKAYGYLSKLPMWGEASQNENGEIETTLRYLTGVIQIDLTHVPSNANAVYVRAWSSVRATTPARLTGRFTALLADDKGVKTEAQLDSASVDYSDRATMDNNWIVVNIREARGAVDTTKVFIPIIAQTYDSLEVVASKEVVYNTTDVHRVVNAAMTGSDAAYRLKHGKNITIKRGKYYRAESIFEIAGSTIDEVQVALPGQKSKTAGSSKTMELYTTSPTTLVGDESGKVLDIPALEEGYDTLKINLQALQCDYYGQKNVLEIKSTEGFNKVLVLNVDGGANRSTIDNIYVNLPKATVVLQGSSLINVTIGDRYRTDQSVGDNYNGFIPRSLVVKKLEVKGTVRNVYANAQTKELIIDGTVTGDVDLELGTEVEKVVVNGKVLGTLNTQAHNGDVIVEVKKNANVQFGTLKVKQDTLELDKVTVNTEVETTGGLAVTGDSYVEKAVVGGHATINRAPEGTVIGELVMNKTVKQTLNFKGGYIKTLTVGNKLTVNNEETIQTGIKTMNGTPAVFNSVWANKPMGNSFKSDYQNYNIYTATQLAAMTGNAGGSYKLWSNTIDLGAANWTPVKTLNANFDGQGCEIKNMTVAANDSVGFFGVVTGRSGNNAVGITNLKITNASVTATNPGANVKDPAADGNGAAFAGILFGRAIDRIMIDGVEVEGTVKAVTGKKYDEDAEETIDLNNDVMVGGLGGHHTDLGQTGKELIIKNTTVKADITGRYQIGGLIGSASTLVIDNVTIKEGTKFTVTNAKKTEPGVTETATNPTGDPMAGSVGLYCGELWTAMTVTESESEVELDRTELGFMGRYLKSSSNTWYFYYGSFDGIVGKAENAATVAVDGVSYTNAGAGMATLANAKSNKKFNVYVPITEYKEAK